MSFIRKRIYTNADFLTNATKYFTKNLINFYLIHYEIFQENFKTFSNMRSDKIYSNVIRLHSTHFELL